MINLSIDGNVWKRRLERSPVKDLQKDLRYELLLFQFQLHDNDRDLFNDEFQESLQRILKYIYQYTNILYLEFVNKDILYDYIKYHYETGFKDVTFYGAIKDVKYFLYFLKHIKKMPKIPEVDLSVNYLIDGMNQDGRAGPTE